MHNAVSNGNDSEVKKSIVKMQAVFMSAVGPWTQVNMTILKKQSLKEKWKLM